MYNFEEPKEGILTKIFGLMKQVSVYFIMTVISLLIHQTLIAIIEINTGLDIKSFFTILALKYVGKIV